MLILHFVHWLQNTSWATALRQSDTFFPVVEGTHILSLALSVGMLLMFDLRLMGVAFKGKPVGLVMREVMKWAVPGFALTITTGLLLFFCQAEKVYTNSYFRLKFLFMFLAGLNALYYQFRYYPRMAEWDGEAAVPAGVRTTAMLSLLFWACVIAFGRIMAYEL